MSLNKKILLFSIEFPPFSAGVATYNHRIVVGMAKRGVELHVLAQDYPQLQDEQRILDSELKEKYGISVTRFPMRRGIAYLEVPLAFNRFLNEHKDADLVYITDMFSKRIASLFNLKKRGVKYFLSVWGTDTSQAFDINTINPGLTKLAFPFLRKRAIELYNHAQGITVLTEFTKKYFEQYWKSESVPIHVIYLGVDSSTVFPREKLDAKLAVNNRVLKLITIARLDIRKNHETVLRAIAKLSPEIINLIEYRIIGVGPERENLTQLASTLEIENRVSFEGRVSAEDLEEIFEESDLHIMPSREVKGTVEGFGLTYVEAATKGIPSIGGNHGGVPEAIMDGETGVLVDSENADEIAGKIEMFVKDRELLKKMGRRSWEVVQERFLFEQTVDNTLEFLLENV